ncbi:MAG: prepilin-type N-terminal cleavage/methylation domain-containing protein [Lachnospiraceae bacterium]|nr:prepilin-type N-terminal cleavage/methylation domain-containing protein [Lachnospiraceae bacterium]
MKKSNKGFTLLELLIAVCILAIIIVPLLRGFVSSHRVNAKSRHLMRATTLAQNEMEVFEKEKLEDLLDDTKFDYDVDDTTLRTDSKGDEHTVYTFKRSGIINDESGRDMFDVVVTLDPSVSSAGIYDAQNTEEMLFMNTVSGMDSATYIQRVRNVINTNGDDEEVYKLYTIRQYPESISGHRWSAEEFGVELERKITLKIEQEDQAGVMTTVAKIRYDYELPSAWAVNVLPPEYYNYTTKDKIFFNNAQTLDEDGNPIELKSVYLFYAPRYDTLNVDEIIIENKDKLPVNVYIIRQNVLDATDKIIGVYEDETLGLQNTIPPQYQAHIEINEGFDADGKTYGRYFTNLNLDLPGVVGAGMPVDLKLNDCDNPGRFFTKDEILEYTGLRSLDSTEKKDRIYTMETAVYEHGADPLTSDPVVRLTGTKIE